MRFVLEGGGGGAGRVGQIRCLMGNVEVAYFQNKLRHPRRQNLAWEPANLRGSRLEFQRLSDLLNFQVLNISIYMHAQWKNEPMLYKH